MVDMQLQFSDDKFEDIQLHAGTSRLDICIDERVNASLMMTYDGVDTRLPVHIDVKQGSTLTILMKNENTSALNLDIQANVYKDAAFHMAYCDLDAAEASLEAQIALCEEGASAAIKSACIVSEKKEFHINVEHKVPHTTGTMEHYAVVKENGSYRMEAIGKINKGAHDSVSHQTTRVLTMSEKHNSEVVPLLLIDENSVKASHATTLGQPDENQLYYLQTRGLSREQAVGLLSVGYIMPITEVFDDEERNEKLKNEIEMKVGLHA